MKCIIEQISNNVSAEARVLGYGTCSSRSRGLVSEVLRYSVFNLWSTVKLYYPIISRLLTC